MRRTLQVDLNIQLGKLYNGHDKDIYATFIRLQITIKKHHHEI